jgi:hypothetical protein
MTRVPKEPEEDEEKQMEKFRVPRFAYDTWWINQQEKDRADDVTSTVIVLTLLACFFIFLVVIAFSLSQGAGM